MKKKVFMCALFVSILFNLFNIKFVIAQSTSPKHPEWSKNATIYEVNVRQFTNEGTFSAFEKSLPRLKELGIDILWLMPINPIGELNRKGSLGSYYSVRDYKAVNPEFGTVDDLKELVKKAHSMGMRVIVDWVANHASWDNVWMKTNPDFFTKDSTGKFIAPVPDWTDVADLNYDNKELWKAMLDAMAYWVKECDIDGYRCDVAAMVPVEFWNYVREELDKIKPVFMLAEASESFLHDKAFDMTYAWPLKDVMNNIAQGKKDVGVLDELMANDKKNYHPDAYRMVFITNHDENSWNGTEYERLKDAVEVFTVLTGVINGMPLVYTGQEAGLDKRLRFFDKDTIDWKPNKMAGIIKKLFDLKKKNKALWNGVAGGEQIRIKTSDDKNIFAISREKEGNKVVAIFNLSPNKQKFTINDKTIAGSYKNLFTGKNAGLKKKNKFELDKWGYMVLVK